MLLFVYNATWADPAVGVPEGTSAGRAVSARHHGLPGASQPRTQEIAMLRGRRVFVPLVVWVWLGVLLPAPAARAAAEELPSRLSDKAFWQLASDLSEAGGSFRSENFLSNENAFQTVIPDLKATLPTGGVYLGVGPE